MNLSPLFGSAIKKVSNVINYQSVRWRRPRKPFWLGLAKSKMFVIPQPKIILTPEEKEATDLLHADYNIKLKSMLNFICNENPRLIQMAASDNKTVKLDPTLEEKISSSLKVNEAWNAESKRLGEKCMEKFIAEETKKAKKLAEEDQKRKNEEQERIDEIIRKEKALSENFITPENLDEAIENCLKNVVEFDFAIDLQGNRYHGRETLTKVRVQGEVEESAVLAEGRKQQNEIVTGTNC